MVIGTLKTLNMVMKKYRSEFESNRVLTELKNILENFQDIHLEFFKVRTALLLLDCINRELVC